MKVIEPNETSKEVRADSPEAKNGFRTYDDLEEEYDYFVPMNSNSMNLSIRRTVRGERSIFIEPEHILVFNIQFNCAGIIKADKMVEPVDFTVNVGREQE